MQYNTRPIYRKCQECGTKRNIEAIKGSRLQRACPVCLYGRRPEPELLSKIKIREGASIPFDFRSVYSHKMVKRH